MTRQASRHHHPYSFLFASLWVKLGGWRKKKQNWKHYLFIWGGGGCQIWLLNRRVSISHNYSQWDGMGRDGTMLGGRRSLTTGPDRLVWSFSNELGLLLYTHQHAWRQQPTDDPTETQTNQPTTHKRQTRKEPQLTHAKTITAERQCPFSFCFAQRNVHNIITKRVKKKW